MNAEFLFGSRTADEVDAGFATKWYVRRNRPWAVTRIQKCNGEIIELASGEFTTLDWVRCRSRRYSAAAPTLEPKANSPEIIWLKKLCDTRTWHWVCNHNNRTAPMWNGSPSPQKGAH